MVELLPLLGQQPLEQGILDQRQVDRIEVALGHVGIDRQRAVTEPGGVRRAVGEEALHRLAGVDRRHRQQKIEAARDLVELLVGVERRGKKGAAAERAEVGRRAGAARRHERARRLEQRIAERDREIAGQLRIESVFIEAVNLRDGQRQAVELERRRLARPGAVRARP